MRPSLLDKVLLERSEQQSAEAFVTEPPRKRKRKKKPMNRNFGLINEFKGWDRPQGESRIIQDFKAVAERISAAPRSLSDREKEELYLAVFLGNTEFRIREPAIEQLNARAAEFAEKGRLVRDGWMLTRKVELGRASWILGVAP